MGIFDRIKDRIFGWPEIPDKIDEEFLKNWPGDGSELAEQIEKQRKRRVEEPAPEEKAQDDNTWSWERREDFDNQIAGALAKSAEASGLIHPSDEFSYEWHAEFDPLIAEAEAKAAEALQEASPGSIQAGDLEAANTTASPSSSAPGEIGTALCDGGTGEAGGDSGGNMGSDFGGFSGGDFGGFSGNFGGGSGGNF